MNITTIQISIGIIISLGVLAFGFGYVYSQFKKGKNDRTKTDLETENSLTTYLKNQVEGFKQIAKEQDQKIADLGKEISAMRAVLDEKDKTIDKYLAILQNRNPELEQFMVKVSRTSDMAEEYITNAKSYNQQQTEILNEIRNSMRNINVHMETQNKEMKIEGKITH